MSGPNRQSNPIRPAGKIRASRRTVLHGGLASLAGVALPPLRLFAQADTQLLVNDITLINPVRVSRIAAPHTTEDVRDLVTGWPGTISIGGGRYSMGGQIAAEDSLHLDMRSMNRVVWLDSDHAMVRVQTGMRWRDLQTLIDPHDLSVKIMQSYSNFTIGGALAVNAHGRYVGVGPLINSVRRIQMVLPDGEVTEASPTQNAQLFYGAIGGYGGLGIITEVELDLVPNVKIERHVRLIDAAQYPAFFKAEVLGRSDAIFHNADLDPAAAAEMTSITWFKTDKPVTVRERLLPTDGSYGREAFEVWALAELPGAHLLRRNVVDPFETTEQTVVWRNHEASLDVASLGPIASETRTYALQEYFIPVAKFQEFALRMSRILCVNDVNALNVSVRQSPADPGSTLAWAREEIFSFVLYYRQHTSLEARQQVGNWTRQLIEASLALGGSYYLPYQLHATGDQFLRAYPGAPRFFALKARLDPGNRFTNKLWDKYYRAAA